MEKENTQKELDSLKELVVVKALVEYRKYNYWRGFLAGLIFSCIVVLLVLFFG